ncbi:hypothetical protein [Flectobacillus roseus]|uniref:SMODS-associated and fused to various effectors domain-containing protein n=1 Tax=Flectobacillus roseus TaxID=502259 RepID=A0ABT6Y318_9BACT|nr:hypothetical protein [Flectobacillus roseus]MDI9857962.1 hypothetical protein [Flectobacillus roseus]
MQKSSFIFERLKKFGLKHTAALLAFELLGVFIMYISKHVTNEDLKGFVHEVGILFATIVPILFVYEFILRASFILEMKENVSAVFEEATKIIVPERYHNIRTLGINDTFYKLNLDMINRDIINSFECEIKFLKIWIPLIEKFEDSIVNAINLNKCSVRIILLDPENGVDVMKKRSLCLKYFNFERTRDAIIQNREVLQSIYNRLDIDKKDKLKLKFHNDFVAISLIGIDSKLIQGFYLHDKIATEGTHIVVRDKASMFHKDLSYHFEKQWNMAKEYKFDLSE